MGLIYFTLSFCAASWKEASWKVRRPCAVLALLWWIRSLLTSLWFLWSDWSWQWVALKEQEITIWWGFWMKFFYRLWIDKLEKKHTQTNRLSAKVKPHPVVLIVTVCLMFSQIIYAGIHTQLICELKTQVHYKNKKNKLYLNIDKKRKYYAQFTLLRGSHAPLFGFVCV